MMQYYILDKKNYSSLHNSKINNWRLNLIQKQHLYIYGDMYYNPPSGV